MDLSHLLCPFQKEWITDPAPLKIVEKGRQEGFTWIEAFWSVLRRLSLKINHYFVSADEETAKNFIADCKFWLEQFGQIERVVSGSPGADKDVEGTVGSLIFPNGAKIVALSSNPKSIRGKRGDVTLDEFAFHDKAKQMYAAAVACRRWGDGTQPGHLHIISTHNGPQTLFYKLCRAAQAKKNPYSWHFVDLIRAVKDGLAEKVPGNHRTKPTPDERGKAFIANTRAECDDEETFEQEYLCIVAAKSTVIRPDVYDACAKEVVPAFPSHELIYGNGLFIGVDCGRSKNLTVCWCLQRYYDKNGQSWYRTVGVKEILNQPFPVQHATLSPAFSHPELTKGFVDQGAQGRALADSIQEATGNVVEPIGMGNLNKQIMAENLRKFAQSKRFTFPAGREDIRDSVTSVRKEVTDKGTESYVGGTAGDHADYFWAAALALHAAEEKKVRVNISSRHQETFEGEVAA